MFVVVLVSSITKLKTKWKSERAVGPVVLSTPVVEAVVEAVAASVVAAVEAEVASVVPVVPVAPVVGLSEVEPVVPVVGLSVVEPVVPVVVPLLGGTGDGNTHTVTPSLRVCEA